MTALQKLALDALDQLGSMTMHELEVACLISAKQRGGFQASIAPLFRRRLMLKRSGWVLVSGKGVQAIEDENRKIDASEYAP